MPLSRDQLEELGAEDTTIQSIWRHEDVSTTQRFCISTAPAHGAGAMRVSEKFACTAGSGPLKAKFLKNGADERT